MYQPFCVWKYLDKEEIYVWAIVMKNICITVRITYIV